MQVPERVTAHLHDLQLRPETVHYNLKRPRLYEEPRSTGTKEFSRQAGRS